MIIKGTVKYQEHEGGFWGIIDAEGKKWRPGNFPEQLKQDGLEVELDVEVQTDVVSMFMWGTDIQISSIIKP